MPAHLNRIQGIHVPMSAFRVATCAEVGCKAYENGWTTTLLEGDHDFGDKAAHDIRHGGFSYTEERQPDGFTRFRFEPGQVCFKGRSGAHRKRREGTSELFYVKDRTTGVIRKYNRPADWVDVNAEHLNGLRETLKRG